MESLVEFNGAGILLEFLIKSTLILIFSLSLVFFFRKKSSSLKHFLLAFSLISLLLLPLFSTFSGGWKTRLLPARKNAPAIVFTAEPGTAADPLSAQSGLINLPDERELFFPAQSGAKAHQNGPGEGLGRRPDRKAQPFLLAVWAAGLILLAGRIFLGLHGAFRLTRQGKKLTGQTWLQLLLHLLKAVSIKRKIRLRCHRKVKVPMTWGFFRPVVIVPEESRNWTMEERSSALFHELSHIKRGDFLVKILARAGCALFWFNPLCWIVYRVMKKEQEKACDELVLKAGIKPSTYAQNLLAIRKNSRMCWNPPSAALGAVGRSQLNERLLAILKQQLKSKEVKMKTKILLSTLAAVSLIFVGLARPSATAVHNNKGLTNKTEIATSAPTATDEAAGLGNLESQKNTKAHKEDLTAPAQTEKTTATQEQKEKTEQKAEGKKKLTWTTKEGKTISFIISPDESEEAKLIQVSGEIEIYVRDDDGKKTIYLGLPGEILTLKKNDEGDWAIESGEIELIEGESAKVIKLDSALSLHKATAYSIKIDKDKTGKNYVVLTKPHLELKKNEKLNWHLALPNVKFLAAPHIEELESVKPVIFTTLRHLSPDSQEIDEQLEKIQEKLKQVREKKKIAEGEKEKLLEEIEAMLEELSETLKKKPEAKQIFISTTGVAEGEAEARTAVTGLVIDRGIVAVAVEGEGKFQILIKAPIDQDNRARYEEAVASIKEKIPEECTVESEIDEENGKITIKISGLPGGRETRISISELVKDLRDELSRIK